MTEKDAINRLFDCIENDKCEEINCCYFNNLYSLQVLAEYIDHSSRVVRCKDCVRHKPNGNCDYGNKPDNWFCADGEKRLV